MAKEREFGPTQGLENLSLVTVIGVTIAYLVLKFGEVSLLGDVNLLTVRNLNLAFEQGLDNLNLVIVTRAYAHEPIMTYAHTSNGLMWFSESVTYSSLDPLISNVHLVDFNNV